jgi:L-alanine-DL-glutamate epimerase-like enolase superfamily enzyme
MARRFEVHGVTWFEEPVSSDDLDGLRFVRERTPAGMRVAAGEYGFDPWYFRRMLERQSVDVLQADATRCLGGTGFMKAAALSDAYFLPLSSHCAPAMHVHFACHVPRFSELEYFHDHVRLEAMIFEGVPKQAGGMLAPDFSRPGLGIELKEREAARFAA